MRIGFDIDGILANFIPAYQRAVIKVAGENLFHPGDDKDPPCWDWPELRGYDPAVTKKVRQLIRESPDFWMNLNEVPGDCSTLRLTVLDLDRWHDIYYITNRMGNSAKWQTEQWLILHLGIERPTVLISAEKGLIAKALQLDCYVDDNLDNVNDVVGRTGPEQIEAKTRTYLMNRNYNQPTAPGINPLDKRVIRVDTLGQFFDKELVNL